MINALNVETNEIHEKSFEVVVCKLNVLRLNLFIQGRKQKHHHLQLYQISLIPSRNTLKSPTRTLSGSACHLANPSIYQTP